MTEKKDQKPTPKNKVTTKIVENDPKARELDRELAAKEAAKKKS